MSGNIGNESGQRQIRKNAAADQLFCRCDGQIVLASTSVGVLSMISIALAFKRTRKRQTARASREPFEINDGERAYSTLRR
jgi:cbb3-type cytochrome oxidase subunit 3